MMKKWVYVYLVILMLFGVMPIYSEERNLNTDIPILSYAKLPLYPANARIANIYGTVRIKIFTNGNSVSKVIPIEGPPMLINNAKEMVMEWKFFKHNPTEFVVTIKYELITKDVRSNDIITFNLNDAILIRGVRNRA